MHAWMRACVVHAITYMLTHRNTAQGLEEDLSNVIGNLETAAVLAALLAFEFWDEKRRKNFRWKFSKVSLPPKVL